MILTKKHIILSFSFMCCIMVAHAQQAPVFKGVIVNDNDSSVIVFGHIYNISSHHSSISDTTGIFSIKARLGDTLVISAVGFYPKVMYMNDTILRHLNDNTISLKERFYTIEEVSVHAWGTYMQFKNKVVNMDIEPTREEKLQDNLKKISKEIAMKTNVKKTVAEDMMTKPSEIPTPVKIGSIAILTPYEKQIRRYNDFLQKDALKQVILEKYNKQFIKDLTRIEEPELTDFYVFCDFDDQWLYEASQYDIGVAILDKYAFYLSLKSCNDSI